jgi:hypothetical protein
VFGIALFPIKTYNEMFHCVSACANFLYSDYIGKYETFLYFFQHRNTTLVSLHSHLTRLSGVTWLTTIQRDHVDRCIHIISMIGEGNVCS